MLAPSGSQPSVYLTATLFCANTFLGAKPAAVPTAPADTAVISDRRDSPFSFEFLRIAPRTPHCPANRHTQHVCQAARIFAAGTGIARTLPCTCLKGCRPLKPGFGATLN